MSDLITPERLRAAYRVFADKLSPPRLKIKQLLLAAVALERAQEEVEKHRAQYANIAGYLELRDKSIDWLTAELEQYRSDLAERDKVARDRLKRIEALEATLKSIQKSSGDWYQGAGSDGPAFVIKSIWDRCNKALGSAGESGPGDDCSGYLPNQDLMEDGNACGRCGCGPDAHETVPDKGND